MISISGIFASALYSLRMYSGKQRIALMGKEYPTEEKENAEKISVAIKDLIGKLLFVDNTSLLLGSGFTIAAANGKGGVSMNASGLLEKIKKLELGEQKDKIIEVLSAEGGKNNLEKVLHVLNDAIRWFQDRGYSENLGKELAEARKEFLTEFVQDILEAEKSIIKAPESGYQAASQLLLRFAYRGMSRPRLNLFTTNYDRLIEHLADSNGLRLIDRFVGNLEPVFRASRMGTDFIYNPAGLRNEHRLIEGVVKFTKLHGSIDWKQKNEHGIVRFGLPFGASAPVADKANDKAGDPDGLPMIYPNAYKDVQTSFYPYADMFRDMSAAICQPKSVMFTYGYGFNDDHIDRIIRDMLTIQSTHLFIIAYDDKNGSIAKFYDSVKQTSRVSLIISQRLADITNFVRDCLPSSTEILLGESSQNSSSDQSK